MDINKQKSQIIQVQIDPGLFRDLAFDKANGSKNSEGGLIVLDNADSKKRILKVKAPATHAGRVTLNDALYQPRRMRQAVSSFTNPYNLPILINHNVKEDAIGRVKSAWYEDYDMAQYGFRGVDFSQLSHREFFKVLKRFIEDGVLEDRSFKGMGHAGIEFHVTDQMAIEKFMDERYFNLSIRAVTDRLLSPLNGKEMRSWWEEEEEDDRDSMSEVPFVVLDNMTFKETSVVNIPGDELAFPESMELVFSDSAIQQRKEKLHKDNYQDKYDKIVVDGYYEVDYKKTDTSAVMPQAAETNIEPSNNENEDNSIQMKRLKKDFTAQDFYDLYNEKLKEKGVEDSEQFELTDESVLKIGGKNFAGPKSTFPVDSKVAYEISKEILDEAEDMSAATKQLISKILDSKSSKFAPATSSNTFSLETFDSIKGDLSAFDFANIAESVCSEIKERELDSSVIPSLEHFQVADAKSATKVVSLESENQKLTANLKDLEEQLDSSAKDRRLAVVTARNLLDVFVDNLKIETYEDVIKDSREDKTVEALISEIQEIFKDEAKLDKIKSVIDGFSGDSASEELLENPLDVDSGDGGAPTVLDQIKEQFVSLKDSGKGESFLDSMVAIGEITIEQKEVILNG